MPAPAGKLLLNKSVQSFRMRCDRLIDLVRLITITERWYINGHYRKTQRVQTVCHLLPGKSGCAKPVHQQNILYGRLLLHLPIPVMDSDPIQIGKMTVFEREFHPIKGKDHQKQSRQRKWFLKVHGLLQRIE